jgi:hypothetical protein
MWLSTFLVYAVASSSVKNAPFAPSQSHRLLKLTEKIAIKLELLLQILLRQRILFIFTLPENRNYPPAIAVVH